MKSILFNYGVALLFAPIVFLGMLWALSYRCFMCGIHLIDYFEMWVEK